MTGRRRLVVDGSTFETPARDRGIGRYSAELLRALAARAPDLDIEIVVAAGADERPPPIPGTRTTALPLFPPAGDETGAGEVNTRILEAHLRAASPVAFLLLSCLQGELATVVPRLEGVPTFAIAYDLIPLHHQDVYLRRPWARATYFRRLGTLLEVDRILTISRTVSNDVTRDLGVDPRRVTCIGGAAVDHRGETAATASRPAAPGPYVLMPTGNDRRKNNRRAVEAFARFNSLRDNRFRLLVTSTFRADERAALGAACAEVEFLGSVPDSELARLYEDAAAVLFPSEDEGLGLPLLEAVATGTPVACSDIPAFREVSDTAFHLFHPRSVLAMAAALGAAVDSGRLDPARAAEISSRHRWPDVAARLETALAEAVPTAMRPALCVRAAAPHGTGRDADLAAHRGAGAAAQLLHPELGRRRALAYVLAEGPEASPAAGWWLGNRPGTAVVGDSTVLGSRCAAPAIHHLDGREGSGLALLAALSQPGLLVLHDTELDGAWEELARRGLLSADRIAVEAALEASAGVPGTSHLPALLAGRDRVVVFDEPAAVAVGAVAARAGIALAVTVLPLPVALVAEPHAVARDRILIPAADVRQLRRRGRRAQAAAFSAAWFAELPDDATALEALLILREGTVPALRRAGVAVGLTGAPTVTLPQAAVLGPAERRALSDAAVEHVRAHHAPASVAEALARLAVGDVPVSRS